MNENCQICVEPFTSTKRRPINCQKCQFSCCTECFKRHCLNGNDPMCMNPDCRSLFQETYLFEQLSSNFMTGKYRQNKSEILFEREKSLMEGTMSIVENSILREKTTQKLSELNMNRLEIMREINQEKINLNRLLRNENLTDLNEASSSNDNDTVGKKQAYLKKCPTDNCKGFLNLAYKCQICEVAVCSKCLNIKGENHECNENELKTAELLRKDTKACPNCGEMIHKIQGCNQMYCISCHTGFDWNSLKIVTGVLHNPHYFEYMNRQNRQNGNNQIRTAGDIICGGPPDSHEIINKFINVYNIPTPNLNLLNNGNRLNLYHENRYNRRYLNGNQNIQNIDNLTQGKSSLSLYWSRVSLHVAQVELPRYTETNTFRVNLQDRIKYMRNQLEEKRYKSNIIRRYNEDLRRREILQLFQTFHTLIDDKLRTLILPEIDTVEKIDNILQECEDIRIYINECFQTQSNLFKVKLPKIVYSLDNKNKIHSIIVESKATNFKLNNK